MGAKFSYVDFYRELQTALPKSSAEQRKIWAFIIIENDVDLKALSELLQDEPKIATRFLWLLSELGALNPNKLLVVLPFLWKQCANLNPNYKTSFANFWLIAGVPHENEGEAIDLLFKLLLSNDTNVTIKARSFMVLYQLTQKYPELKNELQLCLQDQMDRYTNSFKKRATKILLKIENN